MRRQGRGRNRRNECDRAASCKRPWELPRFEAFPSSCHRQRRTRGDNRDNRWGQAWAAATQGGSQVGGERAPLAAWNGMVGGRSAVLRCSAGRRSASRRARSVRYDPHSVRYRRCPARYGQGERRGSGQVNRELGLNDRCGGCRCGGRGDRDSRVTR